MINMEIDEVRIRNVLRRNGIGEAKIDDMMVQMRYSPPIDRPYKRPGDRPRERR